MVIPKLYACKIKCFSLERIKRSVIYDNPKISKGRKINMQERRAHNNCGNL